MTMEPFDKGKVNDLFHVLTWRSPLKRAPVRKVVRMIAGIMRRSGDPNVSATGLAIEAIVDLFEKKSKGGESK